MDDATKLRTNLMALSKNTDKSYGVCLAMHNIFYTQPESTIYGVKKTGGEPHAISDRLQNPRGEVDVDALQIKMFAKHGKPYRWSEIKVIDPFTTYGDQE